MKKMFGLQFFIIGFVIITLNFLSCTTTNPANTVSTEQPVASFTYTQSINNSYYAAILDLSGSILSKYNNFLVACFEDSKFTSYHVTYQHKVDSMGNPDKTGYYSMMRILTGTYVQAESDIFVTYSQGLTVNYILESEDILYIYSPEGVKTIYYKVNGLDPSEYPLELFNNN